MFHRPQFAAPGRAKYRTSLTFVSAAGLRTVQQPGLELGNCQPSLLERHGFFKSEEHQLLEIVAPELTIGQS